MRSIATTWYVNDNRLPFDQFVDDCIDAFYDKNGYDPTLMELNSTYNPKEKGKLDKFTIDMDGLTVNYTPLVYRGSVRLGPVLLKREPRISPERMPI